MLGRKTGEGYYHYTDGKPQVTDELPAPVVAERPPVWVSPRAARRQELHQLLKELGANIDTSQSPSSNALILVAPLGFDVTTVTAVDQLDAMRTIGMDMLVGDAATRRGMRDAAHALFASDGKAVSVILDSNGFVAQRVVAGIVNIGSDICQQGIGSPQDLEKAGTLGLGCPMGPLTMGDRFGPGNILECVVQPSDRLWRPTLPSPWLRRRGALGLSLMHEEQ